MKFFEFIFLKRRLEHDKDTVIKNLERAKKRDNPMWLVLFPEGTGNINCYKMYKYINFLL
jgi:1-acyl-sn-glycerol-3-phosphate acyltransferase